MRRRSCTGETVVTSSPSRKMRPDVGSISRLIMRIVVVLPHRDGAVVVRLRDLVQANHRIRRRRRFGGTVLHVVLASAGCLRDNAWICGEYISTRQDEILAATKEHVTLTVVSLLIAIVVAFPLALLARRSRWLKPLVLGSSTVVYTIPSLALFSVLLPFTGITAKTVVIGLVLYALTVLIRNFVAGLDAVPEDVRDAARGMGFGPVRMLWKVELPLAIPTMFVGIRIAIVSTVALVTIGFVVGYGGLGNRISQGLSSDFKAQVLTASVLCVVLAVAGDVIALGVQWLVTPWRRVRA